MRIWVTLTATLLFASCGSDTDPEPVDSSVSSPACEPNGNRCTENEYCSRGSGFCRSPGLCMARPPDCQDVVAAEVCGCDGETYSNECVAAQQGTSVNATGPCP